MVIESRQQDYEIRELSYSREAGVIRLRWRYKKATDFLVFVYDSRQEPGFSFGAAAAQLAAFCAADGEDTAVMEGAKKVWAPKEAAWKLVYRTKEEFVRDGKSLAIPVSELSRQVPYGISVFACQMDQQKKELHMYPSSEQENTCFVPVRVKAQIRYRKRLFSREKYAMLYLPRIADYRDGALRYRVDGAAFDVPLPQACLCREMVLTLPKRAKVSLRVREADKKYLAVQLAEK